MPLAKPCPSCDSANHELKFNAETGHYYVECRVCHMTGSSKESPTVAIAAWNELPRFHGVPQAPGEFWKETLFPLRHIDDIAKTQEIHVRLNVLEAQVAALFRLTGMFAQYMKADAEYTAGVRDALKDFEKSLKTIGKR